MNQDIVTRAAEALAAEAVQSEDLCDEWERSAVFVEALWYLTTLASLPEGLTWACALVAENAE